mgnify:CR=1 FL=1
MSRTSTGRSRTTSRTIATGLALALACGGVVGLAGCSRESDAQAAVRTARQKVLAINSGASPATPSLRVQVYTDVQNSLRPAVESLEGAEAAAALTLLGEAQTGLAEVSAANAASFDNALLSLVSQARSAAGLYVSQSALATAMASYDPSRTLEDLREAGSDFQADLVAVQASRDALQQKLDALTQAADAKAAQARENRLAAAKIRTESANLDPAARAAAAQRAFEASRVADGYDREAADLRAQAAVVRPQVATADIDIQRWRRQIELATLARTNLQSAVAARLEQAGAARAVADEAAARFDQVVAQIEALRTGDSASSYDSAASAYTAGVATFRRASTAVSSPELRGPMAISLAQAQGSLADVRRSQARSLEVVAGLYADAAALSPALPRSADYAALAETVGAKVDELLAAASEGYANAERSLASAGLRGEMREQADRIGAMLTEASQRTSGEPAPEPQAEPDGAAQPESPASEPQPG